MTTYEISVNGKSYDVTVQKKTVLAGVPVNRVENIAPVVAPVTSIPIVQSTKPVCQGAVAAVAGEGEKVLAPMPGKIIAIKVKVGDKMKKGQELIILEAMKMHNPILAANDGVIKEIPVQVDDSVQSGQFLISLGAVG